MPETTTLQKEATNLLQIIEANKHDGLFAKITGIALPTAFDLGYLPGIVSKFSFPWVGRVLSLAPWKHALTNLQSKYTNLFQPKPLNLSIISSTSLQEKYRLGYRLGMNQQGEVVLFLILDPEFDKTELVCSMSVVKCRNQLLKVVVGLDDRPLALSSLLNGLDAQALTYSVLKFTPGELSTETILAFSFKKNNLASEDKRKVAEIAPIKIMLLRPDNVAQHKIFHQSAITKYENAANTTITREYNSQYDNILVPAVTEGWPLEVIESTLNLGANLLQSDKNGMLPHHHAALSDDKVKNLALFLAKRPELVATCDNNYRSALSLAAHKGATVCVKLLLAKGAVLDEQSKSLHTPLQYAVLSDCPKTLKCMLKAAAGKISSKHPDHPTLLHVAIDNDYPRIYALTVLLKKDKLYNAKQELAVYNEHGLTAFHLAIQKSDIALIESLLPYADILQVTAYAQPPSSAINKYAPELAWERYAAAKNVDNLAIFIKIFDNFVLYAPQEVFTKLWQRLQPQLTVDVLIGINQAWGARLTSLTATILPAMAIGEHVAAAPAKSRWPSLRKKPS